MITFKYKKNLDQQYIPINLQTSFTFWSRFFGFMGRKEKNYGMIFNHTNQIHMFFMRFPLDVYFLDRSGEVIDIQKKILPWKVSKKVKKAFYVIELPSSHNADIQLGDRFVL